MRTASTENSNATIYYRLKSKLPLIDDIPLTHLTLSRFYLSQNLHNTQNKDLSKHSSYLEPKKDCDIRFIDIRQRNYESAIILWTYLSIFKIRSLRNRLRRR